MNCPKMFEPPSQANDINQIQYVTMAWFPLQPSPKVLFESQTVPAPCSRNETPVDIGSKQHNGYGHRGKHGGDIPASDGFGWLQPESNLTRDASSA